MLEKSVEAFDRSKNVESDSDNLRESLYQLQDEITNCLSFLEEIDIDIVKFCVPELREKVIIHFKYFFGGEGGF